MSCRKRNGGLASSYTRVNYVHKIRMHTLSFSWGRSMSGSRIRCVFEISSSSIAAGARQFSNVLSHLGFSYVYCLVIKVPVRIRNFASGSPASASGRVRTRVRRRRPAAFGGVRRRPAASGSGPESTSGGVQRASGGVRRRPASGGVRRPSGTGPAASGARPGHVRAASGPLRPPDAGRQVPNRPLYHSDVACQWPG